MTEKEEADLYDELERASYAPQLMQFHAIIQNGKIMQLCNSYESAKAIAACAFPEATVKTFIEQDNQEARWVKIV